MGHSLKLVAGLTLVALSAADCGGTFITGTSDEGGRAGARASITSNDPPASAGRGNTPEPVKTAPSPSVAGSGNTPQPSVAGAPNAGGAVGASTSSAGAANSTAGRQSSDAGIPLTPTDGWIDRASNPIAVQGAVFAYADPTSSMGMRSDFTGANACISGTAALVDMTSTPCLTQNFTPPATDCYGEFWGAAIGMNLNQPPDPTTMTGASPLPFNASALRGFSFELSGAILPAPKDLRFQVESADRVFCNLPTVKLRSGLNTVLFSELVSQCFKVNANPPNPTAQTAQSALIKLVWQVVTNTASRVPFDFCVSNIRALLK